MLSGIVLAVLASPAAAQSASVLLQIKPMPGDTIRLRMDQTVEMSGVPRAGEPAPPGETGTLVMHATVAIESVDAQGATVTSVTDSVRVNSPPNSASAAVLSWAMASVKRAVRFRIATDGSASVPNTRGGTPPVGTVGAQMPATLPRRPIAVGSAWGSTMQVPLASTADPTGTATLRAEFRLDSLSRSGELAFISIRGRLAKSETAEVNAGTTSRVETSGTVTGQILVDRRRGWITDARTTFTLLSLVSPADRRAAPRRVRMVISQWMRAM